MLSVGCCIMNYRYHELTKVVEKNSADISVLEKLVGKEKPKLAQAHADRVYFKENSI